MTRHEIVRPDGATVAFTRIDPSDAGADVPPLVFIPGWLCTADSWTQTAARLGRTRPCVTVDLPGFGRSGAGDRTGWTLARFGEDVAAVIATLGEQPAILVGHSMGGAIAVEAAIALPARCAQVVAVDSLIHPEFYDASPDVAIEATVAAFAGDFPNAIPAAMAAYLLPGSDRREVADAIARMASADPDRGLAVLRDFLRWDAGARLPRVSVPVSVVAAARLLSEEARARWSGRLDLRTIEDVGHFIMLDDPSAFDAELSAIITDQILHTSH